MSVDYNDFDMGMSVAVYIAMSEEQANREGVARCIQPALPDSKRVYLEEMDNTPNELCVSKKGGWAKELCVCKENAKKVLDIWYKDKQIEKSEIEDMLSKVETDVVWFMGFGD